MRGIQDNIQFNFNEKSFGVSSGLKTTDIASSGVSNMIALSELNFDKPFSLNLNINGSEELQFVPVAKETNVNIKSSWASPSFNGSFLPTFRSVTDKGFEATWKVLHLNRNFPQYWEGNKYQVRSSAFGVNLLITADVYQKSTRTSKYALMVVIFTFAAFFFSEIINNNKVHPIQYLLIGMAIILFYALLLSLSEHIGFNYAYILSATAITLMITGYSRGIVGCRYFTLTVFTVLAILYSYLFIILQLEDYALLMGSLGLLAVLGVTMFITRKIDWYSFDNDRDK